MLVYFKWASDGHTLAFKMAVKSSRLPLHAKVIGVVNIIFVRQLLSFIFLFFLSLISTPKPLILQNNPLIYFYFIFNLCYLDYFFIWDNLYFFNFFIFYFFYLLYLIFIFLYFFNFVLHYFISFIFYTNFDPHYFDCYFFFLFFIDLFYFSIVSLVVYLI